MLVYTAIKVSWVVWRGSGQGNNRFQDKNRTQTFRIRRTRAKRVREAMKNLEGHMKGLKYKGSGI